MILRARHREANLIHRAEVGKWWRLGQCLAFFWRGLLAQKRLKKIHDDLVNYVTCRYFAIRFTLPYIYITVRFRI